MAAERRSGALGHARSARRSEALLDLVPVDVTPALVGGANDQMLAYFIAFYTTSSANWGLAAALGVMLLTATAILYLVYARLVGMGQVKLG